MNVHIPKRRRVHHRPANPIRPTFTVESLEHRTLLARLELISPQGMMTGMARLGNDEVRALTPLSDAPDFYGANDATISISEPGNQKTFVSASYFASYTRFEEANHNIQSKNISIQLLNNELGEEEVELGEEEVVASAIAGTLHGPDDPIGTPVSYRIVPTATDEDNWRGTAWVFLSSRFFNQVKTATATVDVTMTTLVYSEEEPSEEEPVPVPVLEIGDRVREDASVTRTAVVELPLGAIISHSLLLDARANLQRSSSLEISPQLSAWARTDLTFLHWDIAMSGVFLDGESGLRVDYEILDNGAQVEALGGTAPDLPVDTDIALYWATGQSDLDFKVLGDPIARIPVDRNGSGIKSFHIAVEELGEQPEGATLLVAIADPDNQNTWEGVRGESNNVSTIRLPVDIAVHPLVIESGNGGFSIEYHYQVEGFDLPYAVPVHAYWGRVFTIGGIPFVTPISGPVHTVWVRESGSYRGSITMSQIGAPPSDATHLLVRADPDRSIFELAEDNNVQEIAFPDLVVEPGWLVWNTNRGNGVAKPERGLDLTYEIRETPLESPAEIAFYWADENKQTISGPLPLDPETRLLTLSGLGQVNEPARWGAAPENARYIRVVLDPNNLILEHDESNNEVFLKIHTEEEILKGSVVLAPDGPTMKATFVPGRQSDDGRLTLSEAEVVLGVEHFNWRQQVESIPEYWEPITLVDLDYAKARSIGLEVASDGSVQYRDGAPVQTLAVGVPFLDPIVTFSDQDDRLTAYTRAFKIHHPEGIISLIIWGNGGNGPLPDEFYWYWNERNSVGDWRFYNEYSSPTSLAFEDTPSQPVILRPFENPGDHILFETRLVGVGTVLKDGKYDLSTFKLWGGEGYRTNFTWKSNAIHAEPQIPNDPTIPVGDIFDYSGWGQSSYGPGRPPVLSGGVYDVRYDDGSPAAGPPTTVLGVMVNDGDAQRSMVTSLRVEFDGPVTLDPDAFELLDGDGRAIPLVTSFSETDGRTVVVLTFSGETLIGDSLADGQYTLIIHGDKVLDAQGRPLDGDADGEAGGDLVDVSIHRLFGDTDGDGDVDNLDFLRLRSTFRKQAGDEGYLAFLDYDDDGLIDALDLAEVAKRRRLRFGI